LLFTCAIALAGCVGMTPAERAARAEAEVQRMMEVYGPACEKLGYRHDDDKWRDCVLQMSIKDEYRASRYPTTTTCFGHRGFLDCTTF
jgi:hypothetical protein